MMSKQHYNWAGWLLVVTFKSPLKVLTHEYGQMYKILCWETSNKSNDMVIIKTFPTCSCMDFLMMISNSLGKWGKWTLCKHIYHILWHVVFCE
jgi:predicted nucleic acid-binding Zn finger protein